VRDILTKARPTSLNPAIAKTRDLQADTAVTLLHFAGSVFEPAFQEAWQGREVQRNPLARNQLALLAPRPSP
jgi:hypothetical protein